MKLVIALLLAMVVFCGCEGDHDDYDHHDEYRRRYSSHDHHYYNDDVEYIVIRERYYVWSEYDNDYVYYR